MPAKHRITGLPARQVDSEWHEMQFEFALSGVRSLAFIGKDGVAAQAISALGRMFLELQSIVYAAQGIEPRAVEEVRSYHVEKDRWSDRVLIQLTSPAVPYMFAIPARHATGLAEQLKTESENRAKSGLLHRRRSTVKRHCWCRKPVSVGVDIGGNKRCDTFGIIGSTSAMNTVIKDCGVDKIEATEGFALISALRTRFQMPGIRPHPKAMSLHN